MLDSPKQDGYYSTTMNAAAFVLELLIATLGQIIYLFGGMFLFGLVIHFISHATFTTLARAFGNKGTYAVAWLGTPIHELGHAFFCVVFAHRINRIEFFKPDPATGTLGYVSHSWNRSNPYQVLGNLFIGIGPIIIGSALLLGLFYLFIPNANLAWDEILASAATVNGAQPAGSYLLILGNSLLTMVRLLFTAENLTSWQFWVFIYLAVCIASNVRLSFSDIKGSLPGLAIIVIVFLIINLVVGLIGSGSEHAFLFMAPFIAVIYSLLMLALSMVIIGFIITYLVSAAYVYIKYKQIVKPF